MNRTFLTLALLIAGLSLAPAQVQINEAYTGTPDFIELHNCSGIPVDVSGWTLTTAYATTTGATNTVETGFTFPVGTVIPANGYLIAEEFGTAGTPGTLPNSIAVGFNYFWVAVRTLEVALVDAAGAPIDYMFDDAFGNIPALQTGHTWTGTMTTPGDVSARNTDLDTNDASDWVSAAAGSQTPAALNAGQVFPVCGGPPPAPWYETNDAAGSLDLDGVQSGGYSPAITNTIVGNPVTATIDSNVPGTFFEIGISLATLVRGDMPPGIQTANGQNVNIDLTQPVIFLNGGAAPVIVPFPGTLVLPLNTTIPTLFSAQGFFTDPSNLDGVAFTQGVQYESSLLTIAGPTSDDGTVLVDLAAAGAASVSFQGTVYSQIGINSNGRVTLGGVDGDFSVTTPEATTDIPFFGYWADFNPSTGAGDISMTDDGNTITVTWTNVDYFGEAASANNFSLAIDRAASTYAINGLQGINLNPATGITTSDSVFLGISNGNASAGGVATNPGSQIFDPVANNGGVSGAPDDMLFEEVLNTNQVAGTPYRAASIDAGSASITFTDLGLGAGWIFSVL